MNDNQEPKELTEAKAPAVVSVAKERLGEKTMSNIVTLPGDVRAKLVPVPASLIDEVTSRIKKPRVPMWHNPDKDRDEPNPNDPDYLDQVEKYDRDRGLAAIDAMIMFGAEMIDGLPEDDTWLKKLKYLEKRNQIDLSEYDLEDPFDLEFLYKRFIGIDALTLQKIGDLSGVSPEEIESAERSFPSN